MCCENADHLCSKQQENWFRTHCVFKVNQTATSKTDFKLNILSKSLLFEFVIRSGCNTANDWTDITIYPQNYTLGDNTFSEEVSPDFKHHFYLLLYPDEDNSLFWLQFLKPKIDEALNIKLSIAQTTQRGVENLFSGAKPFWSHFRTTVTLIASPATTRSSAQYQYLVSLPGKHRHTSLISNKTDIFQVRFVWPGKRKNQCQHCIQTKTCYPYPKVPGNYDCINTSITLHKLEQNFLFFGRVFEHYDIYNDALKRLLFYKSWTSASNLCKRFKATLPVVRDKEELKLLTEMLKYSQKIPALPVLPVQLQWKHLKVRIQLVKFWWLFVLRCSPVQNHKLSKINYLLGCHTHKTHTHK